MKFFTFYTDNYEPIRDLSLEQKGRLLDAAFLYTLGEPLPEMDPVTSMAWGFIKSHIDGARDKYEEIRQKRSEAGKKSAESKAKQSQQVLTKPTSVNKANYTNTNTNTNTNTKTNTKTNTNGSEILPAYVARTEDVNELADRYIASQAFEAFATANNLRRPRAEQLLKRFVLHLHSTDDTAKTWRDFCSHFASWARYELPRLNEETARPAIPSAFTNLDPL